MRDRVIPATAPSRAALHEAALTYLARYSATEAGLCRVLDRRIDGWHRAAADQAGDDPHEADRHRAERHRARADVRQVVARLVAAGVVDDQGFAQGRARSLQRAGRSRRAIAAHLAGKGVATEIARAALPDLPEAELVAALVQARRRRIGPFRRTEQIDPAMRMRERAALARAGFSAAIAEQALRMDPELATQLVLDSRRT